MTAMCNRSSDNSENPYVETDRAGPGSVFRELDMRLSLCISHVSEVMTATTAQI